MSCRPLCLLTDAGKAALLEWQALLSDAQAAQIAALLPILAPLPGLMPGLGPSIAVSAWRAS